MGMNTATNNTKRRDPMASTIRARVKGGLLEPLETLNLPEGKEVTVTILDVPSTRDMEPFTALLAAERASLMPKSSSATSMLTA
jgi:predicted DNA-binding antitoxin AbrB/MazE fold protein